MPALFIELFSEEIPARMQKRAAADLERLVGEALAGLAPHAIRSFSGPRRIALAAEISPSVAASAASERGPRISAPEQALAGFLRKHAASREELHEENGFWVLNRASQAVAAEHAVAAALPALLRRFPWPKSMRWGGTSAFTWVRPLRRIICLLDGAIVPFTLAANDDDGHGLVSGRETEGHRVHAPGAFAVHGAEEWERALAERHVMASAQDRQLTVADGIAARAAEQAVCIADDPGLIEEVAGLVEWPVALLGRIDQAFMDLPAEVMQVSMRVNQRYFATRNPDGSAAPWFAFVANLDAPNGGAAIVLGNERVLRARFSDARHFWDLDRKVRLEDRVSALDGIVFHKDLGSQGARVGRIKALAEFLAPLVGADVALAQRAAELAKADLTTGMVGEFPELQGVMGGYYARHDGEDARVASAIQEHYLPKGPTDAVPREPVGIAVALADKLDQLAGFFSIGHAPTGSGDPFALRRAALGIIRIIRENALRLNLGSVVQTSVAAQLSRSRADRFEFDEAEWKSSIVTFLLERLTVQFKAENGRADILLAASGAASSLETLYPTDIIRLLELTRALTGALVTPDGVKLIAAYKRAANILRIESNIDGPHHGDVQTALLITASEQNLHAAVEDMSRVTSLLREERFAEATTLIATLKDPLDAFFEKTVVNDPDSTLRRNRLRLLNKVKNAIDQLADFSGISS